MNGDEDEDEEKDDVERKVDRFDLSRERNPSDLLVEMKRIRNQVAHEYITEKLNIIFSHILRLAPELLKCVKNTEAYCSKTLQQDIQ